MKRPLLTAVYILYTIIIDPCSTEQVTDDSLFQMSDDSKTIMGYEGELYCPARDKFCAVIYYIEDDTDPRRLSQFDDDLKMVPFQCTHNGVLRHNAHVVMEGGDGLFSTFYEPQVTIYHDCYSGEKCDKCSTEVRRAQAFLKPVHQKLPWRRQKWALTLDPKVDPLHKNDLMEPLRDHYFRYGNASVADIAEWIMKREVVNREHLLKDDSLSFESEVPYYQLKLLRG